MFLIYLIIIVAKLTLVVLIFLAYFRILAPLGCHGKSRTTISTYREGIGGSFFSPLLHFGCYGLLFFLRSQSNLVYFFAFMTRMKRRCLHLPPQQRSQTRSGFNLIRSNLIWMAPDLCACFPWHLTPKSDDRVLELKILFPFPSMKHALN